MLVSMVHSSVNVDSMVLVEDGGDDDDVLVEAAVLAMSMVRADDEALLMHIGWLRFV
jgi:hypothetical protein